MSQLTPEEVVGILDGALQLIDVDEPIWLDLSKLQDQIKASASVQKSADNTREKLRAALRFIENAQLLMINQWSNDDFAGDLAEQCMAVIRRARNEQLL